MIIVRLPHRLPTRPWSLLIFKVLQVLSTNCESIRPFRSVTWPLLTLDSGIFYHSLAISAFCLSARYPSIRKQTLISDGLSYYAKGLDSVSIRLGDKVQRQSDGIIVSIMGIALHTLTGSAAGGWCWETAQSSLSKSEGATDQWVLHFQALKTILDYRGGVESIGSNPALRHWLYLYVQILLNHSYPRHFQVDQVTEIGSRMDVEGTATRDMEPFFQLPPYLLPVTQRLDLPRNATVVAWLSSWAQEFPAQQDIIDIFMDLDCTVSWLLGQLASQDGTMWARLDVDTSCLLPLLHRCLQLSGKSASGTTTKDELFSPVPCDKDFQDALRHAIILFLAPIRRCFGLPALGTDLHITRLISALNMCLIHRATLNLQGIMFWMLVVGALEACSLGRDASCFFSRILDCCTIMGAKRFKEVREMIKFAMNQLIWLEEVMSSPFALMMEKLRIFMEVPDTTGR